MKILVANRHLKGLGGSETFTYTLIKQLIADGHEVEYFTLYSGIASDKLDELGVPFLYSRAFDLILTGQVDTVDAIKQKELIGPLVQICHGVKTRGEQPSPKADYHIAISEEVEKHVTNLGFKCSLFLNGVDLNRFKPRKPARKKLKKVASLVQTPEAHQIVEEAAKIMDVEVIRLNKYEDQIWEVEKEINKADMVVSLGRGAYEAMACGRPVVVFDKRKYQAQLADGYLDPESFDDLVKNNCSGRFYSRWMGIEDLVCEFEKYDSDHGAELRKIAEEKLNIEKISREMIDELSEMFHQGKPGTIDVVYVLGKGSKWGDNEIRYSIRSFVKHFKDLRNIVVVGECPSWLNGVLQIKMPDNYNLNKDARMLKKIKAACSHPDVSDQFVVCTDDTFLNADLKFADFKGWHEGPIMYDAEKDLKDHRSAGHSTKEIKPSRWLDFVYATGEELKRRNLPDNNYDRAHCPQPIDKKEFLSILLEWDYINNHYTNANIYQNSTSVFPGEDIKGRNGKIYNPMPADELESYLADKIVFNINDNGLNEAMKVLILLKFPEASEYELFYFSSDRRQAVQDWFKDGCNYDEGVAIFQTFAPKNVALGRFFKSKKGTTAGINKLKNTLRLWLR